MIYLELMKSKNKEGGGILMALDVMVEVIAGQRQLKCKENQEVDILTEKAILKRNTLTKFGNFIGIFAKYRKSQSTSN